LPSFLPRPRVRPARAGARAPEGAATAAFRFTWEHCRIPAGTGVQMTRTIVEVAPLWIAMLDHLIAGKEGHASLKG
jgi:hypothetical protein